MAEPPPVAGAGIANRLTPDADQPPPAPPGAPVPPGPEPRDEMDPISLTSEMEPISEEVQKKRKVDATLVRFSAVHDEMVREERERRSRRAKLMPWLNKDNDLDEVLTEMAASPPGMRRTSPEPAAADDVEVAGPAEAPDDESAARPRRVSGGAGGKRPPTKGRPGAAGGRRPPRKRNGKGSGKGSGKVSLAGKIAVMAIAAAVLVLTFMGWRARAQVENNQVAEVAALDENSPFIQDAQKQTGDENFLIAGTSTNNGTAGQPQLSTVMVAHIPADRSRAVVVSFPLDTGVSRPACAQWNNASSTYGAQQAPPADGVGLDAVYATGGPKCLTDTVQSLSGLRINHFVGIDAQGFQNIVAEASGVPLCVRAPVNDSQLGTVVGQPGQLTLTGQQALNFVEASHVTGDTLAAHNQIRRQQVFMAAALRQAVTNQSLLISTSKLDDFLNVFTRSTFGQNMAAADLVNLAQSLQGIDLGKVTFVTLPTTGTLDPAGHEAMVKNDANTLFGDLINNAPLADGTAAQSGGTAGGPAMVDPKTVKIQVMNAGNTTNHIGADTASKLAAQGFQILSKGTDPAVPATVIRYSADEAAAARTLASSVPGATLQVDPTLNGAIILDIGPGFNGTVVAPHPTTNQPAGGTASGTGGGLSTVNAGANTCA